MPNDLVSLAQSTQEIEPFRIILKDEVTSTNDIARKVDEPWVVIVANSQTRGRGRLQRTWFSPKGVNVYMTVLVPLPEGFSRQGLLPSSMALAVRRAIVDTLPELAERVHVKWPNDIYLDLKKLSGILIEKRSNGLYAVGIGINVNISDGEFPSELRHKACSLRSATGKTFHRGQIIKKVLQGVLYYRQRLLKEPMGVVEEFNRHSLTRQRNVIITDSRGSYRAIAIGMEPDGALKIMTPEAGVLRITSADVEVVLG